MLKPDKRSYTPQEYFAMEETAEYKSEYFHGEIFAMAGGTPDHNRITVDLASALNSMFIGGSCEAFASDVRVQIDTNKHYTYPDVVVVCGEIEFAEGRKDTIANPIAIMEVLSDSTKDYDRGTKFTAYRTIKTLREYVLIEQDSVHVEAFFKEDDGTWRLREYFDIKEMLPLKSLQMEIPIKDIYNRVSLAPKPRLFTAKEME